MWSTDTIAFAPLFRSRLCAQSTNNGMKKYLMGRDEQRLGGNAGGALTNSRQAAALKISLE